MNTRNESDGEKEDRNAANGLTEVHRSEAAAFIASMLAELREVAVQFQMHFLVYLLEMAHEEALIQSQEQADPAGSTYNPD